ncbi:MAG: hypothetical protein HOG49_35275 [Candidatus Scalindua sp.]|nr:hypothetical protein [Candidatus Scalindua sp.]
MSKPNTSKPIGLARVLRWMLLIIPIVMDLVYHLWYARFMLIIGFIMLISFDNWDIYNEKIKKFKSRKNDTSK